MENLIVQYIDKYKDEIIQNVVDFVKIPSISTKDGSGFPYGIQTAKAIDFCLSLCSGKGLQTHNYEYYCAEAKLPDNNCGKRILIASHADVVNEDPRCIYEPFGGEIVDNYIIGRGVIDDKAPLIATIYALNFFYEHNIRLNNEFVLLFGANEESGMDDIDYYLKNQPQPDLAIAVDDDFPVVNGENSQIVFSVSGKKSKDIINIQSKKNLQRSIPYECNAKLSDDRNVEFKFIEDGQNTIIDLVNYFYEQNINILDSREQSEALKSIIFNENGNKLGLEYDENGLKMSIKPVLICTDEDKVTVNFDIRHSFSINSEEVINKLEEFVNNSDLIFKTIKVNKGYYVDENNSIVQLLTDVYNTNTHTNCKPYIMSGCTYSRKFNNALGFGAGNPFEVKPFKKGYGASHGPDEAHNIDVLMHAIKIYILGFKALDDYYNEHK